MGPTSRHQHHRGHGRGELLARRIQGQHPAHHRQVRVRRFRMGGSGQEPCATIHHPVQWRRECISPSGPHLLQQAQERRRRVAQH
eukprot:1461065-Pyramimonas_sp.AAC.1